MKVKSAIIPSEFKIDIIDEIAFVRFSENIVEKKIDDLITYEYDEYLFKCRNTHNLVDRIKKDYGAWLMKAKRSQNTPPAKDMTLRYLDYLVDLDYRLTMQELGL
ncbi:MAG: hypothetical protein PHX43_05430 [Alphaproteobacteria bacterium]|nr:hypothetical protein [Alphaproteobacteria bacterium]